MITGKDESRRRLAEIAVDCFAKQSYEYRDLLILNTATLPWFERYTSGGYRVREVMASPLLTLGELRNKSYKLSEGDLLLQWDDDDYYSPERMRYQVEYHRQGYCSILRRQYRLCLATGEWGLVDASHWPRKGIVGTMLHGPTSFKYPAMKRAEDTAFIQKYYERGLVNPQDNPPELYIRLYHGGNTWDRRKVMKPALGKGRFKGDAQLIERVKEIYACTF